MKSNSLSALVAGAVTLATAIPAIAAPTLSPRRDNRLGEVANPTQAGPTWNAVDLFANP